jgi:hypothetical protein
MLPRIPTRTDAFVQCGCGATAKIASVSPIAGRPDHMRHGYSCAACGTDASFEVAKKASE